MSEEIKLYIPAFISVMLTILLVLVFTNELKKKKTEEKVENTSYLLELEKEDSCKESIYTNNIKTYCLKEIYYINNNEKKSLRSVLDQISIEDIILKMKLINDNDEYKLYEDNNSIGNINFKIIQCNNKYIIGSTELVYKDIYCE